MQLPYFQIRNKALLYYELPSVQPPRRFNPDIKKAYSGQVTIGARKRLSQAIDILIQKSPPRLTYNPVTQKTFPFTINFITLTFSCSRFIDGKEAYANMMKPFLRIMRRRGNFSYVWKAEFQDKKDYQGKYKENGGQLHYHIASNQFIPWQDMRKQWNRLQRKNGYLEEYGMKYGHYNPNSTDVHSVYKISDVVAYLSKYMCKEGNRKLDGKVWDSSKDCKGKRFSTMAVSEQEGKIKEGIRKGDIKQINLEHCTIFQVKNPLDYLTVTQFKEYLDWRNNKIIEMKKPKYKDARLETESERLKKLRKERNNLQGCYFLWDIEDERRMKELNKEIKELEKKKRLKDARLETEITLF